MLGVSPCFSKPDRTRHGGAATAALHALGGADGVFLRTTGEQSSVGLAVFDSAKLRSISNLGLC
jgi:hypothetical protein